MEYDMKLILDKTPKSVKPAQLMKVLNEFFIAAGVDGIISGQMVDIESEHKKISKEIFQMSQFTHEFYRVFVGSNYFKLKVNDNMTLHLSNVHAYNDVQIGHCRTNGCKLSRFILFLASLHSQKFTSPR